MTIKNLQEILMRCYSKDLCYPKIQNSWNENNKCLGMCAITSLIVNDYFNGEICKIYVDDISHYFNLIEGEIIDLTSNQFTHEIDYNGYQIIDRNKILTDNTKHRYNRLKKKLIKYMKVGQ